MRRAATALVALVSLVAFAGCGGDDDSDGGDVNTSAEPVEVEVGETFTWNGYVVEDGWKVEGIERSVNMETVTTPEVSGTIVNRTDDERAPIFQMVFSADGDALATVNCSAAKMVLDQSMQFICPGINTTMPEGYDAVVVRAYSRDSGSDSGSDSDQDTAG